MCFQPLLIIDGQYLQQQCEKKPRANHDPLSSHVIWCHVMYVPYICVVMVTVLLSEPALHRYIFVWVSFLSAQETNIHLCGEKMAAMSLLAASALTPSGSGDVSGRAGTPPNQEQVSAVTS